MLNGHDPARARDALHAIPPDLPRDSWVKAGMAAHAAGLDFEDFDAWSSPAGNYNTQACQSTWRSFKTAPGGVGAGALFGMARDHGWQDDTAAPRPAPARATRPAEPPRKPAPGMGASEVFERFLPATNQHGYIVQKQGNPEGLRVVPDGDRLSIAGQNVAGFLAVPAYAPDGSMQSIQFVPPPGIGKKLNLPGASMAAASFTLGTDGPIYLCEGIGAAWSAWQSTGHRAVCCFGWGNVAKIAAHMRQRDPEAKIVICPDVGKEAAAAEIAALHHCAVAPMPEGWPDNSDLNDLFCSPDGGFDVVQAMLDAAANPPKRPPLLKPVSVFDVISNPSQPPAFVWDSYLPRGVVSLIGAHGGVGKSTIALMLAVCAVLGRPLFGVDTEASSALFVSLEDGADVVRHRLAGICKAWLIDPEQLRDRLHIVDGTEHPELFTAETRSAGETTGSYAELRKLVQDTGAGLVLIDNASDAYGADEIQRRQVRAFIRALGSIAKPGNCSVTLLAHVDKTTSRNKKADGGEGYSGSTAWHNSVRSRLFFSRGDDDLLTLEHQKSNLGKRRDPLTLAWPDGGLPHLLEGSSFDGARQQGRADDDRAAAVLKLMAEFASRGQYCSPITTARNNVFAILRSEPDFQKLKLNSDSTRRILNQCQRAGWLEPMDYRTPDRKTRQCWTITTAGCLFAGLPSAPSAPSAPSCHESAQSARGAPSAPSCVGGTGESAHTKMAQNEGLPT